MYKHIMNNICHYKYVNKACAYHPMYVFFL